MINSNATQFIALLMSSLFKKMGYQNMQSNTSIRYHNLSLENWKDVHLIVQNVVHMWYRRDKRQRRVWQSFFIREIYTSCELSKLSFRQGRTCIYVPDLDNVTLFRTQAQRKKKFDILPPYLLGTSLHDINTGSYMGFLSDLVYIIV